MPLYVATIEFTGKVTIEFEAVGDPEAAEVASEVFDEMDKGRLNMAEIDIKRIAADRMTSQDIAERKAEARGDI